MSEKSVAELEALNRAVVEYGLDALGMLAKSIKAMEEKNADLADEVRSKERPLESQYIALEEALFQYLALYQPVAKDMRMCVCLIRIIYNFERIGKMGVNIAEIVSLLAKDNQIKEYDPLFNNAHHVLKMVEDSLVGLERRDLSIIASMNERDQKINSIYDDVLKDLIVRTQNEKENAKSFVQYVLINRHLERCGDQACNISEMVTYMISGVRGE